MSGATGKLCPHCGAPLSRFGLDESYWDHAWDWACFNDACPYYVRGWRWMEGRYGVRASYRYRIDGRRGAETPLSVWSPTAMRDAILPDDDGDRPGAEVHP